MAKGGQGRRTNICRTIESCDLPFGPIFKWNVFRQHPCVIPKEVSVTLGADPSRESLTESKSRRQAIVLVHGMGEQVPMETVRDFADAVWKTDRDVQGSDGEKAGELFSVPDPNSGSRELRRISTRSSRPRAGAGEAYCVRNEFFELYWADSTNDTTWPDFLRWYWRLVFRWPSQVPP